MAAASTATANGGTTRDARRSISSPPSTAPPVRRGTVPPRPRAPVAAVHDTWPEPGQRCMKGTFPTLGACADEICTCQRSFLPESPCVLQEEETTVTGVRVLVGTRKGAFVLSSDGARR